jgi:molybdopterin synthase catalytic subunit
MMEAIEISSLPLSVTDCHTMASSPNAGGQAIFVGTVRNQTQKKKVLKLVFEAYTPMAIKEMQKIGLTLEERWGALKVIIHHRVGELLVGDIAVIIAVSTPHRAAAFEACQYAIDTLKETVPIWKKEFFEDGEIWVAAHP